MKKGIGVIGMIFLLNKAGWSTCSYYASTMDSYVVMEQGYALLYLYVYNDSSSTESITSVSFLFPSNIYRPLSGIPEIDQNWFCTPVEGTPYFEMRCQHPAGGLLQGYYEIFDIFLSGPNFGPIPSFSSDVRDTSYMQVYGSSGSSCQPLASPPSWIRHALDIGLMLWATPLRVKAGDKIIVEMEVANRSTATQNNITPSITSSGPVEPVSGPAPPSLDLPPGGSGLFRWSYKATGEGYIWFNGYASNNNASSISNPSDTVHSNQFSSYTYVKPSHVSPGQPAEVWLMVYRYGEMSAGLITPNITVGPDLRGNLSLPAPASYPAIPTGATASFLYTFTPTGGTAGDLTGRASATLPSPINSTTSSDDLQISGNPIISSTPSVTTPGMNVPITFTVTPPFQTCVFYQLHQPAFTYISGSAKGGYGTNWIAIEMPEGVTFVAPGYPPPNQFCIPAGSTATFSLSYTVPAVPSETVYLLISFLPEYSLPSYNLIIVINKKLTLSKNFTVLTADGNSTGEITARLTDYLGNPLPERGISFFTNRGVLLTHAGITDSNGEVKTTIVAPFSSSPLTGTVLASYKYDPKNWGMEEGFVVPLKVDYTNYSGGNLLYVGSTLFPQVMTKGTTLSFRANFINLGDAPKTITTASYIYITDGNNLYQAKITEDTSFLQNEMKTVVFEYAPVNPNFVEGLYMPLFNYTGSGGDPERTIWDNVLVSGPTAVDVSYFYGTLKEDGVHLFWGLYSGNVSEFEITRKYNGVETRINEEPIPFQGYMDYFYLDPFVPRSDAFYYLHVKGEDGITIYGPVIITGEGERNNSFTITFNYKDEEKSIRGIFSCEISKEVPPLHILLLFSILILKRKKIQKSLEI